MNNIADILLDSVNHLKHTAVLGLHEPDFSGNELAYVSECITSGWVSSVGKFVDQFEQNIAAYTGVPKAVAVVNGTAALHLALILMNVKVGDEVLTPALTFVATTNAIAYTGAVPHFVDSGKTDLSVCPDLLAEYLKANVIIRDGKSVNKNTGRIITALIVMHTLGNPANMQALKTLAAEYHLKLIEDAAEGMGSFIDGKHVGTIGDIGIFSFNGNKIMTTGSGGALVSHDIELMKRAKHLSTTAKTSEAGFFFHDEVGYNYRLANINAALGVAQLERLPEFLTHKKKLADYYQAFFDKHGAFRFVAPEFNSTSNYWLCAVQIKNCDVTELNRLIALAHQEHIMLRPLWQLNNELPMYAACPSMALTNAKNHVNSTLCLPSSASLWAYI
ncbi:perosamine synthetase [Cellvibrio zantedeschiae]|uniref:Perosamine synthetase n=1 Tax=Cellvibrio zantedeschiae TaxID=1237077 RepID=A0ABQ3B3J4_9GAMM|nr:LegC family aminotransferase [Cellvibrio zantedeschiae]GGY72327.1 perosamine synthetase [Cellvibrio zantedeschiae]